MVRGHWGRCWGDRASIFSAVWDPLDYVWLMDWMWNVEDNCLVKRVIDEQATSKFLGWDNVAGQ